MNETIRVATFNAFLNRNVQGELIEDLSTPNDAQAQAVAEIIQRVNPDVILLNEFDFDENGTAIQLFQDNYLSVSQNGAAPVEYPFVFLAPSNTGRLSGFDLNNDGIVATEADIGTPVYANDSFGFGFFPGQFAMVLLSKFPIVEDQVRTFQNFVWQEQPGALLPDLPDTPEPQDFYSPEELAVYPLADKSLWDVPINFNGEIIHILANHPTPPVFDDFPPGVDFNGRQNSDEIRFWADYITPGAGEYIQDDEGNFGGLAAGASFVIVGDQNADPFDGDSTPPAISQLLDSPFINTSVTPSSAGGPEAAERQGGPNLTHLADPAFDTADFGNPFPFAPGFTDNPPGNLRADYALPSADLEIVDAGVFWPTSDDPLFRLVENENQDGAVVSSDHRLVFVDVVAAAATSEVRRIVRDVEFLGQTSFPTGTVFDGTEVGGLSGLTYDAFNDVYYSISDDQGNRTANLPAGVAPNEPARFYTLTIDIADGNLEDGDVVFTDVTTLLDGSGNPFAPGTIDAEGIAFTEQSTLFISSEGSANNLIAPFVNEFSLGDGFTPESEQFAELPIPDRFLPTADQSSGIRNNLAFESLAVSPDGRFLFTATESALFQDGGIATLEEGALARIIQYDLETNEPVAEFVYITDPIPNESNPPGGFADNGLVELLALDNNGTLLALERSFAAGVGNSIRLYQANTQGALDVTSQDSLFDSEAGALFEIDPAVTKTLLIDFAELGIPLDNVEAASFGPTLPDGRPTVILASDNNFSGAQSTLFLAIALDIDTVPLVQPVVESPQFINTDEGVPEGIALGDADDTAIYVHPSDPSLSIVVAAVRDGGTAVLDLNGEILQLIEPEEFGSERHNNVDLVYGFELGGQSVDLAVVSDRNNDTLIIFQIDPETRQLTDVTADGILGSIFGIDDGEQTALGIATYTSPVDGRVYAFVTQREGNLIAQLELSDNGAGQVDAEIVRLLELPIPDGVELEDTLSEGIVVDQELGIVYVAQEQFGIFRASAEPNGGNTLTQFASTGSDFLTADVEGLSIYYGANGTGYLITSSQGDNSFAVFSREGTNEFLGSFAIGENGPIDQVNESDGFDVINVPLGPNFPFGLLAVQDGADDPQFVIPDDEELENAAANFKFVPFEAIAAALPEFIEIDTESYDPRNPEAHSLVNGVASGDTTQTTTVLWARSTLPGEVLFEYSTSASFNTIAGTATAEVTDINLPVKVDVAGLTPGTEYFYRVSDAGGDTEVGRFVTAAPLGEFTGLSFGVSGDWRGELAPYPAIANAITSNLDFFVEHGDTIYADFPSPAVIDADGNQVQQVETLEQYRAKHSEVYSSRLGENFWAELRASTSVLATIDDHEVINDFNGGQPAAEDPRFGTTEGLVNDTELFENGLQAFQEYNPIRDDFYGETGDERTAGERELYRFNTYGSDAATFVLDTRSFRDVTLPAPDPTNPAEIAQFLTDSLTLDRQFLGTAQLNDLFQDLLSAEQAGVTWKFILVPEPIQDLGIFNVDAFVGYAEERTQILRFIEDNDIDNVVFVAADIHGTFVNNLTYQEVPFGPQIASSAFEITTGSVAFDPPFGEVVVDVATATGAITAEQRAFFDTLPVAPDTDDIINDRDDFLANAFNNLTIAPLGLDPLGLDNNLPVAEGLIDATLLQGDYVAAFTFGWTQFDIDPVTQALTVTTYGILPYSQEELLANPDEILSREPQIVSQFVVNPSDVDPTNFFGTPGDDVFDVNTGDGFFGALDLIFTGAGLDLVDTSTSLVGSNRIYGGSGADEVITGISDRAFGGNGDDLLDASAGEGASRLYGGPGNDELVAGTSDRLFGNDGNDTFETSVGGGNNRLYGGEGDDFFFLGAGDRAIGGAGNDQFFVDAGGNNIITGGTGADQFWIATADLPDSANTITDFEAGVDVFGIGSGLGISFADLTITPVDGNAQIATNGTVLALALGVQADSLTEANFVFG